MHHQKSGCLKIVNQYIIPFKGLKNGEHSYNFKLGDDFFSSHNAINAKGGDVNIDVLFQKKTNLFELDITYKGYINICCDRCLEFFKYKLDYQSNLVVKFKDQESEMNDDIWILNINEYELDLFQHFYDTIGVCLPIAVTHPDNEDGEPTCEIDYPSTIEESEDIEDNIDPRWEKLKNINLENN